MSTEKNTTENPDPLDSLFDQNISDDEIDWELLLEKYENLPLNEERIGQSIIVTGPGPIIVRKPSSNENPSKEI